MKANPMVFGQMFMRVLMPEFRKMSRAGLVI
jgi:hypothetical protein